MLSGLYTKYYIDNISQFELKQPLALLTISMAIALSAANLVIDDLFKYFLGKKWILDDEGSLSLISCDFICQA